ncbi:bacitracin ABC transporter ATP-binding protein [Bacillus pseudomycoides]|uniref:ABC transporter ATP-binding protein n=1 Tax=Bacillus pseudomycoides TaxID=64104 RepID=UPI000BF87EA0|nr:ABC transporter ATP-binding protein [Bacillus pseudomycoides]PFZ11858.1 bacitracin ABC transporter ATP-binding protein [Bacillus pseudomycoides]
MSVLEVKGLTKVYQSKGSVATTALHDIKFKIEEGEFVGIMGPSGSGKTTLLNLLATIDKQTSGHVYVNGEEISQMRAAKLAEFRRTHLGFIFQDFNLLDTLSIKENIILPLVMAKRPVKEIDTKVLEIAKFLNIEGILNKKVYEVSGGQQQRAAAARAIIHEPTLILADEPTGNLDSKSAKSLMGALQDLHEQKKVTIAMVTHDPVAASYCERILFIRDGEIFSEIHKGKTKHAFFQEILDVLAMLGGEYHELSPARA